MKRRKIWVGLGTAVLVTSQVAAHEERPLPIPGDGVAPAGRARRGGAPSWRRRRARRQGESRRRGRGGGRGRRGRQGILRRRPQAGGPFLPRHRADPRPSPRRRRARPREALGRGAAALPAPVGGDLRQDPGRPEDLRGAALPRRPQGARPDRQGEERRAPTAPRSTALEERLAAADKGVKAKAADWQPFVVDTVLEMLRSAMGEYEEAIAKGRIAKPVEYQDSRGFVWQAEKLFGIGRRGHRAEGRRGPQGRAGGLRRPEEGLAGAGAAEDAGAGRIAGARRRVEDRAAARAIPVNVDHEGCSSGAISQASS